MDKRHFIKSLGIGGLALANPLQPLKAAASPAPSDSRKPKAQHRVWINPDHADTAATLQQRYAAYRKAGITDIFFEDDSPLHFKTAKANGIKAHRWMWTMNRGEKDLLASHPEWYAKNRKGESCANHPPYVDYYRWLCPSKPEVVKYLEQQVEKHLSLDYVDGIHLDYVRFCDVILPVNLWSQYGIDQSKELPEYDFCYCEQCRSAYKAKNGIDPLEIEHPDQSPSWRKFRYDRITNVVNHLAAVARQHKKPISAAVFPTPEIAKRIVRQDWTNWPLNAVCPMIYHGFYRENISWIGDAVAEGVKALHGAFPLYAGLFLPDFKGNYTDLGTAVKLALQNGAAGVSIFGDVNPDVLRVLSENI
ncbi:family 10 glycosylhydrolase [Chitinophaga nivalis]|uniref:Family 10 glycosylhydrolase n=1 Tax=Chitinophaga nivalis TaxID=2991709 RepID=A0ABT3IUT5_9BACT|nr:family 10 glycosylhydrolase [Chitinophaga nivalis]MCW3462609.1 family 10 glycosylhydrolase [Chitinophaga nivalis]MCW3487700.1 family 10 glycosylhydrolase [Chitinophaga nivalis]